RLFSNSPTSSSECSYDSTPKPRELRSGIDAHVPHRQAAEDGEVLELRIVRDERPGPDKSRPCRRCRLLVLRGTHEPRHKPRSANLFRAKAPGRRNIRLPGRQRAPAAPDRAPLAALLLLFANVQAS